MANALVNGVRLHYERRGTGAVAVVLVHGSWDSLHVWDELAARLASAFHVVSYDRRGHSESERPSGQGSIHEDVDDLATLIEHLKLAPAWVVGNSFGGSIALRLGVRRPELLRGLVAHEPPLFALLEPDGQLAPLFEQINRLLDATLRRIAAGDHAGAAEEFVEAIVGAGAWARLPAAARQMMTDNAPTFLDEAQDPDQLTFNLSRARHFSWPTLLTTGAQSPPMFGAVIRQIAAVVPHVQVETLEGTGHVPHETHPDLYATLLSRFMERHP